MTTPVEWSWFPTAIISSPCFLQKLSDSCISSNFPGLGPTLCVRFMDTSSAMSWTCPACWSCGWFLFHRPLSSVFNCSPRLYQLFFRFYCHGSLLLSLARRASCKGCLIHSYHPTFQGLDQLSVWGLWMLLQPCPGHVPLADLVGGFSFTDHCPQCSTAVLDCTSFFSFTFTSSFKQSLQAHRTHLTS